MKPGRHPPISVLIPARNEEPVIGRLLRSLLRQTVLPDTIVVVDNASTDKTYQASRTFIAPFAAMGTKLSVIREFTPGRAVALDTGISNIRSPIIASTDADCIAQPDWIYSIGRHFERHDSSAIHGRVIYHDSGPVMTRLSKSWIYPVACRTFEKISGFMPISGANCAFRKAAVERVGGFTSVLLDKHGMEDVAMAAALSKVGTVRYDDTVRMHISMRRYQRAPVHTTLERSKWYVTYAYRYRTQV